MKRDITDIILKFAVLYWGVHLLVWAWRGFAVAP